MADKSIEQLIAAEKVNATDLFVLQQSGTAKKLTGQILENWLLSLADGHGGIHSIAKLSSSGLADTYRITLADTTVFDFVVTNGRGITGISKTSTSGLVDTYTISYNDGTSGTLTVTNGEKGDKGDNAYVWIKYASQEPTESSHSIGDIPDDWMGIYSGNAATAPTDWRQYKWFKNKGEQGDTGSPATLLSKSVTYQVGDSGSIVPSGSWSSSVPVVAQGKYLWTKTELQFNTGDPIVSYSVARMGLDGSGSVSSVNNVSPDENGNVALNAEDVGALPSTGGDMTGELRMNGQNISGLNAPAKNTQAANKGYVDTAVRKAAPRNLLDNSDFRNPVNQRGQTSYSDSGYTIDRWKSDIGGIDITVENGCVSLFSSSIYNFTQMVGAYKAIAGKTVTFALRYDGDINLVLGCLVSGTTQYQSAQSVNGMAIGTVSVPDSTDAVAFFIQTKAGIKTNLKWAALYEGEYTAETLPEYKPKGYGAELAECQRYYREFTWLGGGNNFAPIRVMLPLPIPMRIANPTVTYKKTGGNGIVSIAMNGNDAVDITVSEDYATLRVRVSADL